LEHCGHGSGFGVKQWIEREKNMECKLVGNLFDVIAMITDEQRSPQKYSESHLLYHAEMSLIDAIYEHPDANARMLSEIMGVTQGAITQMTAKLSEKKLIERYKMPGNKKDRRENRQGWGIRNTIAKQTKSCVNISALSAMPTQGLFWIFLKK